MLRFLVLLLACAALLANYYCYDNPAALKTQLDQSLHLDESTFALLYSVYSIPNIVLPFFGGWLVDRLGAAPCVIFFGALLGLGQALFAIGASSKSLWLVLAGRVVFGFGGESMTVGASTLLADWFRGKEMAFAMGCVLAIARLGSVFNNIASPRIAAATSVATAIWAGAILCAAGVASACVLLPLERRRAKAAAAATSINNVVAAEEGNPMDRPLIDGDGAPAKTGNPLRAIGRFKASFWMLTVGCLAVYGNVLPFNNVASSLLMERTYFQPTPPGCALTDPDRCESPSNPPLPTCPNATDVAPPLPRVADIGGKTYHNLTKDDVVCTDDAWSAAGACTHEFCARQAAAEALATEVMSIPYVISAVGTPFIGLAVDRFGGRALLAALCPLMLVIAHVLLGFVATLPPELPLVLQGVAFAFFATALWPSVPYTVPAESEGLAFGVVTALQNGGLGLFPLLVSLVYDASGQRYIPYVELVFVAFAAAGLAAGLALNLYDCTHGHQLNRSNYLKAKPATAGSTIGEQLGSTRGSIGSRPDALASFSGGSPFSSGTGRSPAQSI